jgi:gliding motility-associated-like protein
MKRSGLTILVALLIFSCTKEKLAGESDENKKLSPEFQATTTPIHVLSYSSDIEECFYQNNFVKLIGFEPSIKKYEWFKCVPGKEDEFISSDSILITSINGKYRLDIEKEIPGIGEKDSSIFIELEYCEASIDIPSSFTPDRDNQFDNWLPIFNGVSEFYVRITDDNNNILFESESENNFFEGQYNGEDLPSGTYKFYIYGIYRSGYLFEQQGVLELVRFNM